jgi:hypothetical protein
VHGRRTRRGAKHTEGLIWDSKIEECQLCGLHGTIDGTDGILNAGRKASIGRVEDIARDPQIGTSDEMVNQDVKRKEMVKGHLPASVNADRKGFFSERNISKVLQILDTVKARYMSSLI